MVSTETQFNLTGGNTLNIYVLKESFSVLMKLFNYVMSIGCL